MMTSKKGLDSFSIVKVKVVCTLLLWNDRAPTAFLCGLIFPLLHIKGAAHWILKLENNTKTPHLENKEKNELIPSPQKHLLVKQHFCSSLSLTSKMSDLFFTSTSFHLSPSISLKFSMSSLPNMSAYIKDKQNMEPLIFFLT